MQMLKKSSHTTRKYHSNQILFSIDLCEQFIDHFFYMDNFAAVDHTQVVTDGAATAMDGATTTVGTNMVHTANQLVQFLPTTDTIQKTKF